MDIVDPTFLDHRANVTAQHRSISTDIGVILDQLIRVRYNNDREFENSLALRVGGVFTPEAKLSSDITQLDETTQTLGGIPVNLDTTAFSSLTAYAGRMPRSSNAGVSLHYDRADGMRWSAGIEYSTTAWSEVADEWQKSSFLTASTGTIRKRCGWDSNSTLAALSNVIPLGERQVTVLALRPAISPSQLMAHPLRIKPPRQAQPFHWWEVAH